MNTRGLVIAGMGSGVGKTTITLGLSTSEGTSAAPSEASPREGIAPAEPAPEQEP